MLQPFFVRGLFSDSLPPDTTKEEVESACFPKYFVAHHSHLRETKAPTKVQVVENIIDPNGDSFDIMGTYHIFEDGHGSSFYARKRWYIEKLFNCGTSEYEWSILTKPRRTFLGGNVVWRCPYSQNLETPPNGPWVRRRTTSDIKESIELKNTYE